METSKRRWNENAIASDLLTISDFCNLNRSSIGINDLFLFYQIFFIQLQHMKHQETDLKEFCDHSAKIYQNKYTNVKDRNYLQNKLKEIDELRTNIGSTEAILIWYTKNDFLYDILNSSFRSNDIITIFHSRFVIRAIWQELKKRQIQSAESITVYRGQRMSNAEVELLRNSTKKLISMKSFLSTSRTAEAAEMFAGFGSNSTNNDLAHVLFIIDVPPQESNETLRPFGDISDISQFKDEGEILFMIGSVFRIEKFEQKGNNNWIISMTKCDQEDRELSRIFGWLKGDQNINGIDDNPDSCFVDLLLAMGMPHEAQQFCHKLLDKYRLHSSKNDELAKYYYMLGRTMLSLESPSSSHSSHLKKSLHYFDEALVCINKTTTNCRALCRSIYHGRANAYRALRDFRRALDTYEIAMVYYAESIGMKDRLTANLYADLGQMYFEKNDLFTALHYYKRALDVAKKTLPSTHPEMGIFNMRLVTVYAAMRNEYLTLFHLYNALNIDLTSLPNSIPALLSNCGIFSIVYAHRESIRDFEENKNIIHADQTIQYPDIQQIWSLQPKTIEYSCPWCLSTIWTYGQTDFLKGCPCYRCLSTILQSQGMDPAMASVLHYFVHLYGR